ncbi:hypothetical protein DPMN_006559 [Dreissena polymorpha]|uniref:Uncharacterized protein n=1 Tax=Dreissena polymorpha TaxID=45954 RepID=A0A9D4RXV3_DREPO|nr:hypothetical protein DPMN_006559 [Dreissena polymorpha]
MGIFLDSEAVECLPDLELGVPGFNPNCGWGFFWIAMGYSVYLICYYEVLDSISIVGGDFSG